MGILIPRAAVDNRLRPFARELQELDRRLSVFQELATGSREGFEIESVSSSELSLFVNVTPEVGACIALAVERLVALYRDVLEIRVLRNQLADKGLEPEDLSPIDENANTRMSTGIEPVIEELMERGRRRRRGRQGERVAQRVTHHAQCDREPDRPRLQPRSEGRTPPGTLRGR